MNRLGLRPEELDLADRINQLAIDELVPIAHRFGEQHAVCRELVEVMAEHGMFGLSIGTEYGGVGTSDRYSTLLCLAREHLGYHDSLVDFTFGCQGLGTVAIVQNGSEAQRARYLPDLVAGRRIFAFALTEPGAGSDVRGMETTAERDGDSFILNGTKTFISGAPDADVYVVLARTDGKHRGKGVTAFIVERGTPGFRGRQDISLCAPHAIGTLTFDNCVVPGTNVIGDVNRGFAVAFGTLEIYRPSVGALAVGMGQRAYDLAARYAGQRLVGDVPLVTYEAIRLKLARMWSDVTVGRALVYHAATCHDRGLDSTREAAMAKLFATEAAHRAIYESQQIYGGLGVTVGQEVEALSRHIRQATIYEGTSEIQRLIIARAEVARPTVDEEVVDGESPKSALRVVREGYEAARRELAQHPELVASQGMQFRLADAAVSLAGAELVDAQRKEPDATRRAAAVSELAVGTASAKIRELVDELHRRAGYLSTVERAAVDAVLMECVTWSEDQRLLELAELLLGVPA